MEELLEYLKKQPKEILHWLILELMRDEKVSFAEVAKLHTEYLEHLKRYETERLMELRSQVIGLWCGTKKELPARLTSLIQEGKDKGWININQEEIDKSKWNKGRKQ